MSKKFLLDLPDSEHQSLKVAAAQMGVSMHTFIRDAIREKILREQTANTLYARDADANDAAALAKANTEKPASYNEPIRPRDGGEDENPPGGFDRVG